jgi:hypothetical protein
MPWTDYPAVRHARARTAVRKGKTNMILKTTKMLAAALGAAVAMGGTAALAQGAPYQPGPSDQGQYQQGPYQQSPNEQGPYGQAPSAAPYRPSHHHHLGIAAVIRSEMGAGRISKGEGSFLLKKIREIHAERRAQREARSGEEGAPPGMQQPSQQPH